MQIKEIDSSYCSLELFDKLYSDKSFCFFLDSGVDSQKLGRFSFMGAEPFLILKSKGRLIEITEGRGTKDEGRKVKRFIGNPFSVLKGLLKRHYNDFYSDEIPFLGGAVGYFSYDLCYFIEKLPSTAIDDIDAPDLYLGFYDEVVAVDHLKGKAYKISNVIARRPKGDSSPVIARESQRDDRSNLNEGLETGSAIPKVEIACLPDRQASSLTTFAPRNDVDTGIKSNFPKESYIAAINRAKEYIRQGDIYQVNLSQRFSADLTMPPFELYKRLRWINPAPFAVYLDFGGGQVISASPERFLKIDAKNRKIETRPIKGTRPRGRAVIEDERLKQELINSPKDRAEHIMIVDLERNDLGRVCEYGSVEWSEPMVLEKYSTVFHLVSTVSGVLKEGTDAVDCLKMCFPGGSITGAPKIRSMEIIDELEPTKRSVYTGAIGYLGFNGNMDTNIVIRTFISKGNRLYFQVGGGIVADSDPEAEYQETLDKAKALIEAIGLPIPKGERVGVRG